jgi:hypothetical protein
MGKTLEKHRCSKKAGKNKTLKKHCLYIPKSHF